MKSFVFLFATYFFILSILPCGDAGGGLEKFFKNIADVEEMAHEHDHDHQHEQEHNHSNNCSDDYCSPICACSCCSIVLDFPAKFSAILNANRVIPSTLLPLNLSAPGILYQGIIWHPPILS